MWDRVVKCAGWFEKAAKAKPIYLYHGTSLNVLPNIMSQGLIREPKSRRWHDDPEAGFEAASRQSLPGVYLTDDVLTALQASHIKPGSPQIDYMQPSLLIMVAVQPQSLVVDEDYLADSLADAGPSDPQAFAKLYTSNQIQQLKNDYIKENLRCVNRDNKELIERVKSLLNEGFLIALNRRAAYIEEIPNRPDPAKAERDFKRYEERMSKTLKTCARPGNSAFTARYDGSLGFAGSNKIVAVFREYPKPGSQTEHPERFLDLIYPDSWNKMPPEAYKKIRTDWQKM